MSLPADVARCPGKRDEDEWPFKGDYEQCLDCLRRLEGVHAYVHASPVLWMRPP